MDYEILKLDDGTIIDEASLDKDTLRDVREGSYTLALKSVRVESGVVGAVVESIVHTALGEASLTLEARRSLIVGIPVADVTSTTVNRALADASAAACAMLKTVEDCEWNRI